MSPKSGIFSLTLQLWEHQISPGFAFSSRILLDLGQEKGISLRSCLSSSADCSSKMLIPENSRGIQGHAALLELLSALKNSLFSFFPPFSCKVFPFFSIHGHEQWEGTEISLFLGIFSGKSHLEEATALQPLTKSD